LIRAGAIELRPEAAGDERFLFEVYASTRAEELAQVPWTDEQRQAFLQMQFQAQRTHYAQYYAAASFDVIVFEGTPVGRLCVLRQPEDICVVDIAILPAWRSRKIGTVLLQEIFAEAARTGKTVSGHVEFNSPALALWQRLGFEAVEDKGMFVRILWRPPSSEGGTPQA